MANAAVMSSGWPIHLSPGNRKDLRVLTNGKCGSVEPWVADTSHTWKQKRFKSAHKWQMRQWWALGGRYISHLKTEKIYERSQMANAAVMSSGWPIHLTPGNRKDLRSLTNGKCGSGELWVAETSHTWKQKRFKSVHKWQMRQWWALGGRYISHLETEKIEERSQMANAAMVSSGWPIHLTPGNRNDLRALTNGNGRHGKLTATIHLTTRHRKD